MIYHSLKVHISWQIRDVDQIPCSMTVLMYGAGTLKCSFSLSPKDLPDSSLYSSGQLMCGQLNLDITLLFWYLLSLSLEP